MQNPYGGKELIRTHLSSLVFSCYQTKMCTIWIDTINFRKGIIMKWAMILAIIYVCGVLFRKED